MKTLKYSSGGSSNLLRRTPPEENKPVPVAGFVFEGKNYVNFMSNSIHYRKPRLVKAKQGWYIDFTYRIPEKLKYKYPNKNWLRFRIIQDMNRRKGDEKQIYADWLLNEITDSLRNGFNPFENAIVQDAPEQSTVMDAATALQMFLDAWGKRGLEPVSLAKYKKCVNRLGKWLHENKMYYAPVANITTDHIETFLQAGKFSNREYNNTFDFIRTCFNYLVKKEVITKSPCAGIDKLKTNSTMHRFYDAASLTAITKALLANDPYCYLAFQTVYYLCIRADKELMNLKVGNIQWEQNKILLDPAGTKGKSARYIPMDTNIKDLFLKHGIDKYPADYFVFGIKGTPAKERFGTGFFSKRFRKVRIAANLSEDMTIYGAKHTRVIHLKQDGLSDADIMSLTGHKDFVAYAKYLKDLGMSADAEKINKVSRKV